MTEYIHAQKFFFTTGAKEGGYLEIKDGKFGAYLEEKPAKATIIDYEDKWIAPGLVDTHIHGYKNHDVMDNDP